MADSAYARLGAIAEQRWGLVTTAQAEAAGLARKQLVRMAAAGAIERVARGVYRMAGVPPQSQEAVYATWLALGGATATRSGGSSLVAGGVTAAVVHEIGDFFLDRLDFIVPARKGTRLPDVRLRIRQLAAEDVIPVNGLPALTVERTIADLVETGMDMSLVAHALRDAVSQGKVTRPERLRFHLTVLAARRKDARLLTNELDRLAVNLSTEGDRD
ncbi:type IV toxin-antitoxin system AbiEi family antitoxin domain-containing protein [Cryptosporangium sp. NPDC048952]|uniref:type IV toxin-antitoxin system AbiEi family antitoxin domain-containing protein n=1 Tax=Cryptosporangium sp. NPDC048952 TaxID=3363961 RepID=UPI00371F67CF